MEEKDDWTQQYLKSIEPIEIPVETLGLPLHEEEVIKKAKSTLNEDQLRLFDEIMEFIQRKPTKDNPSQYYVIEGYAGTGKTYLVSKIINCFNVDVAMTAPTNKAVKILADNKGEMGDNVVYATIHKLLALTIRWKYPPRGSNEEPKQILVRNYHKPVTLNDYRILIVDEVSMLDDELLDMIHSNKEENLKVIFMGDPAQIPPVNRYDAVPLIEKERNKWKMEHGVLNRIMRQTNDNKILETAYQIRNNRFDKGDPILSRLSNKDVIFYCSLIKEDKKKFLEKMLESFNSEEFKENANYCKTIAWTNKTVNTTNLLIRRSIFDNPTGYMEKIIKGEKLIANKPIKDDDDSIIFNTSDEFTVMEYNIKVFPYTLPKANVEMVQEDFSFVDDLEVKNVKGKVYNIKYYEALVKVMDKGYETEFTAEIKILHEDGENPFIWALSKLKSQKNWEHYTKLSEKFADVKYNYAITAHKSQGSTYNKVFLIEDDIDMNQKTLERNRIKYTAVTRPKHELHILSKWNQALKIQRKI